MKLKKSKKGFTLIEMVIVLAIMGILIGLIAPAAVRQVKNARIKADAAAARAVGMAIMQEYAEGNIASPAASATEVVIDATPADSVPANINTYIGELPNLKIDSSYNFYYLIDNDQVHIRVGTGTDNVELYPEIDPDYGN